MNRTICTLSVMNNRAHILVGRYLDGKLYIKDSYEVRDKIGDKGERQLTRAEQIESALQEQSEKGAAVYVDEPVQRFSENYDCTPLIFSENLIIHEALKCYFDFHATSSIAWGSGATKISVNSIAQSVIDEKGKPSYSIDSEQLSAAASALLLMCYHAVNCDVSDLSYLKQLNTLRRKQMSQKPMFANRRRRR